MERRALGIDLGGSAIKVVVAEGGVLGEVVRFPHEARGLESVVRAVAQAFAVACWQVRLSPRDELELPIGLAVAGLVREGVVERSGNLALVEAPLRDAVEKARGRKLTAFLSDARSLGIAASIVMGPDVRVALGLGTGVGGSLVVGGEIVRERGLGHGVLLKDVPLATAPCALGHDACLEAHLGAAGLVASARKVGLGVATPRELDELASSDERARAVLERAGQRLAQGVEKILDESGFLGREAALVLSGGVATSQKLRDAAADRLGGRVRVSLSRFGSDAAVAGAALAALTGS